MVFLVTVHVQFNSIQFYSHFYKIFTLYIVRQEYANKGEEEGKKKINGLDRSVRWSEELSFRANHRFFCPLQDPQFSNLQMNERDR